MDFSELSQISVLDMRLICAISRHSSVSDASSELRLSQSAASYRLDKMRAIFDDPIFVNVRRKMRPTPYGERIVESFAQQIESVLRLAEPNEFDPKQTRRAFRVISPIVDVPGLMRSVPNAFFNASKSAQLTIEQFTTPTTVDMQLHGNMDFYVATAGPPSEGIERIVSPVLKLLVHYDPNFRDPPRSLEEMQSCRRVALSIKTSSPFEYGITDLRMLELGCRLPITVFESSSITALKRTLIGTDLIYTGTDIDKHASPAELATAELPFECDGLRHEVRWSSSKNNDPGHIWMRGLMLESFYQAVNEATRIDPTEGFTKLKDLETL